MTPEELIETMHTVLAEEREGILRFDSDAVAHANEQKTSILRRLRESPLAERPALLAAHDELQPALRCNLILLTHARAYLRELQEELARERPSTIVPLVTRKVG